ncbi:MAG: hypothetical protein ACR2JF_13770 [Iamia sp.]
MTEPTLSDATTSLAAVLLLSMVFIEYGGTFLLKVARGREPATDFQRQFARAGHGHAGVLVLLALVVPLYVDGAGLDGAAAFGARTLIPASAILMPAGFFFSSAGAGRTEANRWIVLVWAGVVALAAGLVALALGLLDA